jgi:hypothetical protein
MTWVMRAHGLTALRPVLWSVWCLVAWWHDGMKKEGKGGPVFGGTLPRAIYLLTREQLFRNPRGHHQRAARQQQASARMI